MTLTIFYDSACPLCSREMAQLKHHDRFNKILLEDLNAEDISERYPMLDVERANTVLHGITEDGQWLLGLDVTARAWGLVGKHCWVKLLRLPLIKPIADKAYLSFAANRYQISYWLTGQKRCDNGQCQMK
ncbi:thiol-disulfide oxidoreductase DCC family protein [Shewanella maritima]|uniref:thiol-disulfide oxidoreductase DCC family protein n=1 Tax=Shewanella maritima TaxID=2520507 RepID=UPI003735BEAB